MSCMAHFAQAVALAIGKRYHRRKLYIAHGDKGLVWTYGTSYLTLAFATLTRRRDTHPGRRCGLPAHLFFHVWRYRPGP
jgi:hypothetical protein